MYISPEDAGFDRTALRQGDIIAGVPFVLFESVNLKVHADLHIAIDSGTVPDLAPTAFPYKREAGWTVASVPIRFCTCAVLTNCCDLEIRGNKKPSLYINLARLREIPTSFREQQEHFASLRANRDPRNPESPGYIDHFYLESHPALQNTDWRIHYNQVVSIPSSELDSLLERKLLQLNDRTRMRFKIKLAFTTGRPNNEELDAGLENPWAVE